MDKTGAFRLTIGMLWRMTVMRYTPIFCSVSWLTFSGGSWGWSRCRSTFRPIALTTFLAFSAFGKSRPSSQGMHSYCYSHIHDKRFNGPFLSFYSDLTRRAQLERHLGHQSPHRCVFSLVFIVLLTIRTFYYRKFSARIVWQFLFRFSYWNLL